MGIVDRGGAAWVTLTPRQAQILTLVAEGYADKEIGKQLGLSPWTIKTHVSMLMDRLGARNRTHAAVMFMRDKPGS
jgi:DNA-binding NarL/FixJ family response regulator